MEEILITGLEELERHLQHLVQAPDTPLDAKLFDEVELQLTGKLEVPKAYSVWWQPVRLCLSQSCERLFGTEAMANSYPVGSSHMAWGFSSQQANFG